jgi:hypothetical protein
MLYGEVESAWRGSVRRMCQSGCRVWRGGFENPASDPELNVQARYCVVWKQEHSIITPLIRCDSRTPPLTDITTIPQVIRRKPPNFFACPLLPPDHLPRLQLGLITHPTPFLTGRPYTLVHGNDIYDDGAVGIAFCSADAEGGVQVGIDYGGLEPLGDVAEIAECVGCSVVTSERGESKQSHEVF